MNQNANPIMTFDVESALAARLSTFEFIRRLDSAGESDAHLITHALADIEKSSRRVLFEYLPKLVQVSLTADDALETLVNIGMELQHIHYHIREPRFFQSFVEAGGYPDRVPIE